MSFDKILKVADQLEEKLKELNKDNLFEELENKLDNDKESVLIQKERKGHDTLEPEGHEALEGLLTKQDFRPRFEASIGDEFDSSTFDLYNQVQFELGSLPKSKVPEINSLSPSENDKDYDENFDPTVPFEFETISKLKINFKKAIANLK